MGDTRIVPSGLKSMGLFVSSGKKSKPFTTTSGKMRARECGLVSKRDRGVGVKMATGYQHTGAYMGQK